MVDCCLRSKSIDPGRHIEQVELLSYLGGKILLVFLSCKCNFFPYLSFKTKKLTCMIDLDVYVCVHYLFTYTNGAGFFTHDYNCIL